MTAITQNYQQVQFDPLTAHQERGQTDHRTEATLKPVLFDGLSQSIENKTEQTAPPSSALKPGLETIPASPFDRVSMKLHSNQQVGGGQGVNWIDSLNQHLSGKK